MKITKTTVEKIQITEVEALDPISVICEDFGTGEGKISIECYGKSWCSYWGAMGSTVKKFFLSIDNGYAIKNLAGGLDSEVIDEDAIAKWICSRIDDLHKDGQLIDAQAAEWVDRCNDAHPFDVNTDGELIRQLTCLDEWWYDLPQKPNPDYEYLSRIVDAVKAALKEGGE